MTAPAWIILDRSLSASTGMCESVAPDLIESCDDGALVVLQSDVPADQFELASTAARSCPTPALRVD